MIIYFKLSLLYFCFVYLIVMSYLKYSFILDYKFNNIVLY